MCPILEIYGAIEILGFMTLPWPINRPSWPWRASEKGGKRREKREKEEEEKYRGLAGIR